MSGLYQLAGIAALTSAVIIPAQVAVFIASPPPLQGTALDWFALYQRSPLVGLINLDLLLVVDNLLLIPILLALYLVLRKAGEPAALLAAAFGLLAVVLYILTNPSVEMLSLSRRFAAAASDADRTVYTAAAQALLSSWTGTAFHVGYIVGSIAGILWGALMRRGAVFSRMTGDMAILGNAVGLGLYVPRIGVFISVFSVLFLWIWYVLMGLRFLRLPTRVQPS